MDISMPEMNALDATRVLTAEVPEVRVVILTASEDQVDLFDAVKAGAQGLAMIHLTPPFPALSASATLPAARRSQLAAERRIATYQHLAALRLPKALQAAVETGIAANAPAPKTEE